MIGRTISHYTISAELGRGGMGVVYRADDARLGRSVAIKVLPPMVARDPEAKNRFVQEARAASAFDHPNICSIYDIGETEEGELFLVMPVYEGGTLRDRMDAGVMAPKQAMHFGRQIAAGLSRAHGKGIVHRDIKPDNLMVLEDDRLVILDFGVAKLAEGLDLTSQGSTIGTAAYMSPEQARGESVDGRSDLWALGAIMYEALTGRRPFPGGYDQAVIYGILNTEPEPIDDTVPHDVSSVVTRLLEKNQDDRFAEAEEVLAALEKPAAVRPEALEPATERNQKAKWIGAGLAAAVIAIAVWFGQADQGGPPITAAPALAVMPFEVLGAPDLAYLAEGMPTLLSAALDGVGDLRAVDPHSVSSVLDGDPINDGSVQRVIARFGAEGAVVGSATQLGPEIRLQAAIHHADGSVGEDIVVSAQVVEDLPAAVDALARRLIAGRFEGRGNAIAGLSAATSTDFEALKFYMQGEALARSEEWQRAYEAFGRAVEIDSTFAMAWFRMASMSGWGIEGEDRIGEVRAAVRHSAGLPPRAKALIDIEYNAVVLEKPYTARRLLEDYTRGYPDDAYGWYRLGDNMYHWNRRLGHSHLEAKGPLERALALDPANAEVTIHLAGFAVAEGNWAMVDSIGSLAPESARYSTDLTAPFRRGDEFSSVLTHFGQAVRAADDISNPAGEVLSFVQLAGDTELYLAVVDTLALLNRNPGLALWGVWPLMQEGRYAEAFGVIGEVAATLRQRIDQVAWMALVVPPTYSSELLEVVYAFPAPPPEATSEVLADPGLKNVSFALGALLVHQENWTYLESVIEALRGHGDPSSLMLAGNLELLRAMQNGEGAEALASIEDELEDYRWGRAPEGFLYDGFFNGDPTALRRWLRAELLFEADRIDEAARWYRSLHQMTDMGHDAALAYATPAHRRLAEIAEQKGDVAAAVQHYERVLHYWRNADPALQPLVTEAQSRLDALLAANSGDSN
jgi:tetratricopeptide (TPR) repeat protein